MKKLLCAFLAALFALSLAGCPHHRHPGGMGGPGGGGPGGGGPGGAPHLVM